jgi:hypothetical protein
MLLSITNQSLLSNLSNLSNNSLNNELYCPALFDNLCWPQTRANHSVTVSCSPLAMQGVDSTSLYFKKKFFYRKFFFDLYRISYSTLSSVGKLVTCFI